MASFPSFLPTLEKEEGGEANVAGDRGGETYRGISRVNFPDWAGWSTIDARKPIAYNTVFPDLEPLVSSFYKANFWDPLLADQIKNQNIANILVDWKVNGDGFSVENLQKILVTLGILSASDVDGDFGLQTLAALNKANQTKLFDAIQASRKAHYDAIVANDPTQAKFYTGWMTRLYSFATPIFTPRNIIIGCTIIAFTLFALLAWYKGWLAKWFNSPELKFG